MMAFLRIRCQVLLITLVFLLVSLSGCSNRRRCSMRRKQQIQHHVVHVPSENKSAKKCLLQKSDDSLGQQSKEYVTLQIITADVASFLKELDNACYRCRQGRCVPDFMLTEINKQRRSLYPYLQMLQAHKTIIVDTLCCQQAVDLINELLGEFYSKYSIENVSPERQETLFIHFIHQKAAIQLNFSQQAALAYAFYWFKIQTSLS